MIRNLSLLGIVLALIGAYTFYDDYHAQAPFRIESTASLSPSNQIAPDFDFRTMDGRFHRLSDFQGKVIVLNFWATWCAPCVVEFPQMLRLAALTEENAVFIFLSLDDNEKAIKKFLKKHGRPLSRNVLIARDADKTISQNLFQTYKLPETFLIGPDLRIHEKIIGADLVWDSPEMKDKIRGLSFKP